MQSGHKKIYLSKDVQMSPTTIMTHFHTSPPVKTSQLGFELGKIMHLGHPMI